MVNPFQEIKKIALTRGSIGETNTKCKIHPKLNLFKQQDGTLFCGKCKVEQEDAEMTKRLSEEVHFDTYNGYLLKASILDDTSIFESRILNYLTPCSETKFAKENALKMIVEWKQGSKESLLLVGNVGVGKSMLAFSILHELNQEEWNKRCMYVSVDKLFRLMYSSIREGNNEYSENTIVEMLSSVDFLVLDDLGAESGNVDTQKQATEFKSRVLSAIYSSRQNKVTITTTNLIGEQVVRMYDKRTADRLINHTKIIKFQNAKSMRKPLPF